MKQLFRAGLAFALAFFFCLFLASCHRSPAAPPGAPVTQVHALSQSAYDIANALNAGEREFESLYSAGIPGVSDDDYAKTVITIFEKCALANKEYIANLATLQAVDATNKAQVIAWTASLFSSVNTLMSEGVLGIKSPDARAKVSAALAAIPAAEQTIAAILGIDITPAAQKTAANIDPATNITTVNERGRCALRTAISGVCGIAAAPSAPLSLAQRRRNFTEVNFGSRSATDRNINLARDRERRGPGRILQAAQSIERLDRCATARSRWRDQRRDHCPQPGVFVQTLGRRLNLFPRRGAVVAV